MRELGIGIAVFLGAAVLLWAGAALALEAEVKCESDKNKEAGKYAQCRLKAESQAVKKGTVPDYSKCDSKFQKTWAKIEEKAGPGVCPSEGDQDPMKSFVSDCADCIALALSGGVASCTCTVVFCASVGGVEAGEACWFLGGLGESCDTACGNVGLVYDPATATYAGDNASGGTLAHCLDVLALVGGDFGTNLGDLSSCIGGFGCWSRPDEIPAHGRCQTELTDSSASDAIVTRACACQEP